MASRRVAIPRTWSAYSGPLLCVLIALCAAQPILVTGRLPQGHDALFHLHRVIQLDALLREGIVFSRWAPDLARGFGYPLFNYYAPLSYYLPEALHLVGVPFVEALAAGYLGFRSTGKCAP
ncbi:MAG: hypothetical protein ACUVX9_00525 [Anaerolineae bacterium]